MQEKINEINKRIKVLENVASIVIWGAGEHTCKLFEKTELLTYAVGSIVDMDTAKQGQLFFGYTIKGPYELDWEKSGAVVISVPGKEREITEMLLNQIKFKGSIIGFYEGSKCTPFYRLYDERVLGVCYLGDYHDWKDASDECEGYSDSIIIEKVINSTQKVLDGSAAWERDSCLFYKQKYAYNICAAILRCAIQSSNQGVRILDIGGALGSTYFQNRRYLKDVKNLEYIIAEQSAFADYGQKNLKNSVLKFIDSSDDYAEHGKFDIVLMSASLQYISQYEVIISKIMKAKPRYVILDRILISDKRRICKELVPEQIYRSSYPVTIFDEGEIFRFFEPEYELIEEDVSSVPEEVYFVEGKADSRFYVFQHVDDRFI